MANILNTAGSSVLPANEQAAGIWNAGGEAYDRISRQIADAIEHCVERLAPKPGERILDVATGTGWTACRVSARGATVTGLDFSATAIGAARRLDRTGNIDFQVGDAESLPFAAGEFDAVISTFGVMFCSDPAAAGAELARVCKPGGRLALATWDSHGGVFDMFQVINRHKPAQASPATSPFDWSKEQCLNDWLGNGFELGVERATSYYLEEQPSDAWEAFATGYGPLRSLIEILEPAAATALRRDFESFHEQHRSRIGILVPRPYVVTVGIRHK